MKLSNDPCVKSTKDESVSKGSVRRYDTAAVVAVVDCQVYAASHAFAMTISMLEDPGHDVWKDMDNMGRRKSRKMWGIRCDCDVSRKPPDTTFDMANQIRSLGWAELKNCGTAGVAATGGGLAGSSSSMEDSARRSMRESRKTYSVDRIRLTLGQKRRALPTTFSNTSNFQAGSLDLLARRTPFRTLVR